MSDDTHVIVYRVTRTGQDRTGQDRTGQDRTGQDTHSIHSIA